MKQRMRKNFILAKTQRKVTTCGCKERQVFRKRNQHVAGPESRSELEIFEKVE